MVEIYDYSKMPLYLTSFMKVVFHISIILLTIILITSLLLWLVGVKIKSEKTIKIGMKLSISMILLLCLLFGMITLIAKII